MSSAEWLPTEAAADALSLSVSTLHTHKRSGLLEAGKHYYAAGTGLSGALVWNVSDVRSALLHNTRQLAAKAAGKPADRVEVYQGEGF